MSRWIDKHFKWVMTIPIILFILLMIAYPLLYTLDLSFHSSSMSAVTAPKWVGLKNYTKLFNSSKFYSACEITLLYTAITVFFQTLIGLAIAVFINRKFRMTSLARTIFLLPVVATPVSVAYVWKMMYDPVLGIFNEIVKAFGNNPIAFVGDAATALYSVAVIEIWEYFPVVMLICLGGLSNISADIYEAAEIDGASRWQMFGKITMPLLSPTLLSAITLRLIDAMKAFDVIYTITQGGPSSSTTTLNVLIYKQAFENFRFGEASATVLVFFAILVAVVVLFNMLRKKVVVDY